MTRSSLVRAGLIAAMVAPLAAGAVILPWPVVPPGTVPPRQAVPPLQAATVIVPVSLSLERATARPLFRRGRKPAPTPFDPAATGREEGPLEPAAPKPGLALSGILWGPEPVAVLEGVPGAMGSTVMRAGERAAGLRVVRIGRTSVTLEGFDTTWVLTLRNPWP